MKHSCREIEPLLSGYLDRELTQQQSQRVHGHIEQCSHCQGIYQDLLQMKREISSMEKQTMSEQQLDQIMKDKPANGLAWLGWILLISGLSIIVGFVAYNFIIQDSTSTGFKLTISAVYGGFVFLFLSVLRQRLIARKTDRYKGVDL